MAAVITPDPVLLKALYLVLLLVAADVLLGIVVAIKDRQLDVRRLPSFLSTEVLPYVMGLVIMSGLAMLDESGTIKALAVAATAAYSARMVAALKDKTFQLFGVGKN